MLRLMNFCFVELKGAGSGFFGSLCEVRIRSTSRYSATGVRYFCLTSTVGLTGSAAALIENIGGLIQNQYHQAGTWESAHHSSIWDDSCSLRPARNAFGPNGCGNRRQRVFSQVPMRAGWDQMASGRHAGLLVRVILAETCSRWKT